MKKFLIIVKGYDIHPAGDSGEQEVESIREVPDKYLDDIVDLYDYLRTEMELTPDCTFSVVSMFYLGDFSE